MSLEEAILNTFLKMLCKGSPLVPRFLMHMRVERDLLCCSTRDMIKVILPNAKTLSATLSKYTLGPS
jgi:hypothetical protein